MQAVWRPAEEEIEERKRIKIPKTEKFTKKTRKFNVHPFVTLSVCVVLV